MTDDRDTSLFLWRVVVRGTALLVVGFVLWQVL
jgi:hypothetical protein